MRSLGAGCVKMMMSDFLAVISTPLQASGVSRVAGCTSRNTLMQGYAWLEGHWEVDTAHQGRCTELHPQKTCDLKVPRLPLVHTQEAGAHGSSCIAAH